MPNILEPEDSKVYISPYSQRILQYGITDSKVYLSKAANTLLLPWTLGNTPGFIDTTSMSQDMKYEYRTSCILDGLKCSHTISGNVLHVVVGMGSAIVDDALLVFPRDTELSLDLTSYGTLTNCGKVVVSINFRWLDNINGETPKLKISYLNPDDDTDVQPNDWWTNIDNLIINMYEYEKDLDNTVLSETIKSYVPEPTINIDRYQLKIKDYVYEVAPLPKIFYHIIDNVRKNFSRRITYTIPGYVDSDTLPESTIVVPIKIAEVGSLNIKDIQFNINWTSDTVNVPTISDGPAAIAANKNCSLSINQNLSSGIIQVTGTNNNIFQDGVLCYLTFQIKRGVQNNEEVDFDMLNPIGTTILSVTIQFNTSEVGSPELYVEDPPPYTITRPGTPGTDILDSIDWDKLWKYAAVTPFPATGLRQFYADVDISLIGKMDVIVQCYINNFMINPNSIQHISNTLCRIWMPEPFVSQNPIPNVNLIIMG